MDVRCVPTVLLALCPFLVAGCSRPVDFSGFWKTNCTDAFGVQIKKQPDNLFSVSFCGPAGCFAPGQWMPNTPITGDPKYKVLSPTTIEIVNGEHRDRYTRCTTNTDPGLDYANIRPPNNDAGGGSERVEPSPGDSGVKLEKDPHRPACVSTACRQVRAFVKRHYCGASPFANGPDDSCDIRDRRKRSADVKVIADYRCSWNASKDAAECKQTGQVTAALRSTLVRQLHRLGVPDRAPGETYFEVWQSDRASWSLAMAYYSHRIGDDVELCQVVAIIDQNGSVRVLRQLPLKKTDVDVPDVTQWSPLDLADTSGSGKVDVVLVGDAYENHWIEVIRVSDDAARTIFSGLGYYL